MRTLCARSKQGYLIGDVSNKYVALPITFCETAKMNIPGAMCVFGGIAVVFSVIMGFLFLRYRGFPSVLGTIEESSIEKVRSSWANPNAGGSTIFYIIAIKYNYCVNGATFSGEKVYSLGKMVYQHKHKAQKVLDSMTTNGSIRVFYNPSRPAASFLQNGTPMLCWFPFVIGVGMILFGYYFLKLRQ